MSRLERIISGGQTGVDRAALDAAMEMGVEHGGYCPRGRRSEDGVIDARYMLTETDSPQYRVRTERNVAESDGTLILCRGMPRGGTLLTLETARRLGKPHQLVDLAEQMDVASTIGWLCENGIRHLNVAGPRESQSPGIYSRSRAWLERLLEAVAVAELDCRPKG